MMHIVMASGEWSVLFPVRAFLLFVKKNMVAFSHVTIYNK